MHLLWAGMILFSLLFAALTGRMDAVTQALLTEAQTAVEALTGMCGAYVFWSGLLEIGLQSGMVAGFSKGLRPLMRWLFPASAHDPAVTGAIAMGLGADMLGLGNAATPFGVEAVRRMSVISGGICNDDIQMFLVLNAATVQLCPTIVIALRAAAGAARPADIMLGTFFCSALSMGAGIAAARLFARLKGRKK